MPHNGSLPGGNKKAGLIQGDTYHKSQPKLVLVYPGFFVGCEQCVKAGRKTKAYKSGFNKCGEAILKDHPTVIIGNQTVCGKGINGCGAHTGKCTYVEAPAADGFPAVLKWVFF